MTAYDLAELWEAHCRCEFETRDVEATMATMVAEPYVNHIPTMTGGVGFDKIAGVLRQPLHRGEPAGLGVGTGQPYRRGEFCGRRIHLAFHSHHPD